MAAPRLIHLNGPPGIGKSTIARRYAADHPGVLNLDVDRLRSFVGGVDFLEAGEIVRPLVSSLIRTHLAGGRDVVFPQFLLNPAEVASADRDARESGGEYVGLVLMDDCEAAVRRFHQRPPSPDTPWLDDVNRLVASLGGDTALRAHHRALQALVADRPGDVVVTAAEGRVEETYAAVREVLRR